MKPIGPLMWEHRLIERMVDILSRQIKLAEESQKVDTNLIAVAVDFFRTYAELFFYRAGLETILMIPRKLGSMVIDYVGRSSRNYQTRSCRTRN